MRHIVLSFLALVLISRLVCAAPSVALTLSAHYAFAPVTVRVTVKVPKDARNRTLCVVYDSDDAGASASCWPLAGEAAPVTHTRYFVLGPGHYGFVARIGRNDGSEAQTPAQRLQVEAPY